MTTEQIKACGRIYALLRKALGKDNLADDSNVTIYPLQTITVYVVEAHRRKLVTEALDKELMEYYAEFSVDEWQDNYRKPMTLEQQGVFLQAKYQAMYKPGDAE
nr:MAG TPA: hypothetical protein [Caudoviricetes sp.]DAG21368.1 MAG TPA: hypothetical protein [Bacteriophage sp.]